MKPRKKKIKRLKSTLILVNLKVEPRVLRALKIAARIHNSGNLSERLREGGLYYKPPKTARSKR